MCPKSGNIWIIGATDSGKSTLAKRIAKQEQLPIIEMGEFVRSISVPNANYMQLVKTAEEVLQQDYRYFSKLLKTKLREINRTIIVGTRNPIDFVDNYNPNDKIIILVSKAQVGFEQDGLDAITKIIYFLDSTTQVIPEYNVEILNPNKDNENWYEI